MPVSRRAFVAALTGATLGLGCVSKVEGPPGIEAALRPKARRLKVGHTGITWGYAPPTAEEAITAVAGVGYHGFESFGHVLQWWEPRGGLKEVLDRFALPLRGAYCPFDLTDAAKREENLANARIWGRLIREAGGSVAVVGPNSLSREGYDFAAAKPNIVVALNEIGAALTDAGVTAALHPHSGSCVQTTEEVVAVMDSVDTRVMFLTPDTGELLRGGADPLRIVRDYLSVVRHVHLKDFNDGPTNDGFCPVGQGRVNFPAILDVLERSSHEIMLMVELNPQLRGAGPVPVETAEASRSWLHAQGYAFR